MPSITKAEFIRYAEVAYGRDWRKEVIKRSGRSRSALERWFTQTGVPVAVMAMVKAHYRMVAHGIPLDDA